MNTALSLPPEDDLDTSMRKVAQAIAMGIYEIPKILEVCGVQPRDFFIWKEHPRFTAYLKTETEAWNSAHNTSERTKLKAGIVMEEWMPEAFIELRDRKQPLNHRVELGKLIAKLAGMGETANAFNQGPSGSGFSLQINISPGKVTTISAERVTEDATFTAIPDEEEMEQPMPQRRVLRPRPEPAVIPDAVTLEVTEPIVEEEDDYDPFKTPDTLGDL